MARKWMAALAILAMGVMLTGNIALAERIRCNGGVCRGTQQADVMSGTSGADQIFSEAGNDEIAARGGNDRVNGGAGDDKIFGEEGDDRSAKGLVRLPTPSIAAPASTR
jgi:Ca2+-binding RTX toxin-like protein